MIKKSLKRTTQAKQQTNHVSPPYRSQTLPELDKAETTAQTDHVNGQHRPQTALFQAEGMHCAGCAIIIERKLKKLEGVQDVRVNSYTGKVELVGAPVPSLAHLDHARQSQWLYASSLEEAAQVQGQSLPEKYPQRLSGNRHHFASSPCYVPDLLTGRMGA